MGKRESGDQPRARRSDEKAADEDSARPPDGDHKLSQAAEQLAAMSKIPNFSEQIAAMSKIPNFSEQIAAMSKIPNFSEQIAAMSKIPNFSEQIAAMSKIPNLTGTLFDQERVLRAWRNAMVHGSILKESVSAPGEVISEVAVLPPRVPPRVQLVQKLAPPDLWPESAEAKRIASAAERQRQSDVVVLAADIRHSSSLMNEAVDPYAFAAALEEFVTDSRKVVWSNHGWFANFTGDGFLAFWPVNQRTRTAALRQVFTSISTLFRDFENVHIPRFARNSHSYREDVGLAIGLDHGNVALVQVGNEVTIVGQPVVGATRLVAAASVWEVLANNHLGEFISAELAAKRLDGVDATRVVVPTKDYEQHRAFSVSYIQSAAGSS
jgi:class 3 adenylate cyclase